MAESGFKLFYNDLRNLIEKYENHTIIKLEHDLEHDIVKIFGEKIDSVVRAKMGVDDAIELAYTTAEHHPYWAILYNCLEMSKTVLEKWDGCISKEDLDEMKWHLKEIENNCINLENHSKENNESQVRDK
tara:strand:- start:7350 stop:7739 length:390 start_codon:yes stop_codon:yes gene_type:complete